MAVVIGDTAVQSLFVAWYNLARKHEALKGKVVSDGQRLGEHVWTVNKLLEKVGEMGVQ